MWYVYVFCALLVSLCVLVSAVAIACALCFVVFDLVSCLMILVYWCSCLVSCFLLHVSSSGGSVVAHWFVCLSVIGCMIWFPGCLVCVVSECCIVVEAPIAP